MPKDLPPPPYPPPLPVELNQYSGGQEQALTAPTPTAVLKKPHSYKKALVHNYRMALERTPDIVDFFVKPGKKLIASLKSTTDNLKTKYPVITAQAKKLAISIKKLSSKAWSQFSNYMMEESSVYDAFIKIGMSAIIFSLLISLFVSPATWIILALAGALQLFVGKRLKSKSIA